ncbi:MAG: sialidase family protein [Xanthomonadales bacterium]|nr:sialidase family protein [Xanthomonadales bacterium]
MHRLVEHLVCAVLFFATTLVFASEIQEIKPPASAGSLAPSFASLEDGRVVLTWLEPVKAGHALKFSVLDETGFGPARTIAQGDDWFANWADTPGLFVLPNGDWMAHWLVKSGPSTYAYDVVMAGSGDEGQSWSETFTPHADGTQTEHGFVSYFADADDRAGLVWLDGRETGGHSAGHGEGAMTLRTATIGPDGAVASRQLLDERVCDCCQTAAAMTPDGPVVVYRDRSDDEIRDLYVVRRSTEGWSKPRRLHADDWRIGACPVNGPAIVTEGDRVGVAWFTIGGGEPRVELAISTDAGASFKRVDTLGPGTALGRVDLAAHGNGFVLSWVDRPESGGVLRLAGYDWSGRQRWLRSASEVDAGRASGFPRLAAVGNDDILVAWTGVRDGEQRVRVGRLRLPDAASREPQ